MAAQTSKGTSFSHLTRDQRRHHERALVRPRAPPKTTPVPALAAGLTRLRELRGTAESNRQRAETRTAAIARRLAEVEAEKARIQSALEQLGGQLDRANEAVRGAGAGAGTRTAGGDAADRESVHVRQGGLDDIGGLA